VAHEASHQWWGHIVGWRSYRDQWLSEGFAEYSGVLYTSLRKKPKDGRELIKEMRKSLLEPPATDQGITGEKLYEVGPLILGHRVASRRSQGAYQALIYNKGGLVLRMLHFLFTDPATGEGQPFFDMMGDFVNRYRNKEASTEQFIQVANEHFIRTPIAQKYSITDLDWFFAQWVYQTALPSFRLEYSIRDEPNGQAVVEGTLFQENVPENWAMVLPLVFTFEGNQMARTTLLALGPSRPFSIPLPVKPKSVELDPDYWVLSEKTETDKK
jgi:aminopeptidase N